jgi:hypothetical protein
MPPRRAGPTNRPSFPSSPWDILEALAPPHLRAMLQEARISEEEADAAFARYLAALVAHRRQALTQKGTRAPTPPPIAGDGRRLPK